MDRRIKRTQQQIKQAFIELLKTKHFNKITVTDICTRADINRSTFYEHYLDAFDLYEKLEMEYAQRLLECLMQYNSETPEAALRSVLEEIKQHSNVYGIFFRYSGESMKKNNIALLRKHGYFADVKSEYDIEYIISGILAIVVKWIESGERESTTEMAAIIYRLLPR